MSLQDPRPKPHPAGHQSIVTQYAKQKILMDSGAADNKNEDVGVERQGTHPAEQQRAAFEAQRKTAFERRFRWTVGFWVWLLCIHVIGIGLFTSGFLLTRLVLNERSECQVPPIEPVTKWEGRGTVEGGCWHPKSFDKAIVILVDALRYDFTVPVQDLEKAEVYHNAFTYLYETAIESPEHAFLLPFIADPPTATLQRLKGLTTGTLPTFIDVSSNFGGTAIEEDNLLMQLKSLGKRIVQLGDDTWISLFPGYFEPNISKAYDSFNVWDLHTVDNGVLEHIFPLMEPARHNEWDVLIGHFLGVDHAGHRYGPNHAAMTAKLQQMDRFIRDLVKTIDDDTLLVVMGDHGMDGKGDHGGESDDEVEAALWMYSKRPAFGRTKPEYVTPPATAKIRPVNQIDLVPTLALALGIPIPYNNLGRPIEEVFAGSQDTAWDNLAAVSRMAAAGIGKYQASYFAARHIAQASGQGSPADLWERAKFLNRHNRAAWSRKAVYEAYTSYQEETLKICKDLWARFDVPRMVLGITVMASGVVVLLVYVTRKGHDDLPISDDPALDLHDESSEKETNAAAYQTLSKRLVRSGLLGTGMGTVLGAVCVVIGGLEAWPFAIASTALASLFAVIVALFGVGKSVLTIFPSNLWGWLSVIFTLSQSIGFAANSYTIWEDSISLFFLSTFGFASAVAALRRPTVAERYLGIYHSILFIVLARLGSLSKLCREEQMPYCKSTYYASANSSTSAPWQLVIPFVVFLALPSLVRTYMMTSRSYEGLAPMWIGYVFRVMLFSAAFYWTLDAADNGEWVTFVPAKILKTVQVYTAQLVLAVAFVAGTTTFVWAPPCVSIFTSTTPQRTAQITVLGYGNTNGARYLLLLVNFAAASILVSKPMGGGAMGIMLWQILCLIEILDLNAVSAETIGPVVLALMGNFHFFKTGHQAVLSSIQWDSAFIPLFTVRYPWSALAVMLNTFAGQILACVAVPLVAMWKTGPKRRAILETVTRALGVFVAYYAVQSLATMAWAGYLRRHLMLYRVFSPRYIFAAIILVITDLVGILVALVGTRSNALAVSEVFGWAD